MTPATAAPDGASRGESPARQESNLDRPYSKAALCLVGAVASSGALLLILQSHLIFFADEWTFLLHRRGLNVGAFLDPYNDHIVIAPVASYKALLGIFGMSSSLPFQIVATLVFLLSAVLSFIYLRERVGDWLALFGTILILFLGAAWSDLLWPFQIAFSGSIAAGIAAFLALERDDRRGDLCACVLLVVSTCFNEIGISFAIGSLVSIALGPAGRRRRLYVPCVPFAFYGAWYLGWGHKAPQSATLHNFIHSPQFVFDAISQNLASLLGLATQSSDVSSVRGLNWGRILLVLAIGFAFLRLRRTRRVSRGLWTTLATGGSFWFLTALNAYPALRTPSSGRYQYPGAVFVLLIAAELLRGIRIGWRSLAAVAAVTIAAATSGVLLLHKGYLLDREVSDLERARLTAVDIGRAQVSPQFLISLGFLTRIDAPAYFSAVDAFGSPAYSEPELARSAETSRITADQMLASAQQIELQPVGPGAFQARQGSCQVATGSPPGSTALTLGPGTYILRAQESSSATVELARFADQAAVDLGALQPGSAASITFPTDRSTRPWRLFAAGPRPVLVCSARLRAFAN